MSHAFYEPQPQPPSTPYSLSGLPELSQTRQLSADYFLKLGNRHYNQYLSRTIQRDLDMAINYYKQALEINPNLAEAYLKLAAALWDKGAITLDTAIEYCEVALRLDTNVSDAHLFLGYFYRRADRLQDAAEQFRHAIRKTRTGGSAKAHMALGRILIAQAAQPRIASSWQRLAMSMQGLREFTAGCILLPADPNTFQVFKSAFFSDLKIVTFLGLGRTLKTIGLGKKAMDLYGFASRHLPQEPIFFHLQGDLALERRNPDGAIYFYNRAQELDPDNPTLHKKLGHAYKRCNDLGNAAKSLEKVVETDAQDFETVYTLAQIYTDRSEYIRALYHFKDLLRESPKNPYLHSNMAYVLFKLEDYDGAIRAYRKAIDHGEDPIWTATVAQTLGTIQYQIKQDLEAAVQMFELAYQLDASNLDCLGMLGDIYTEQGNFEAAIQVYRYILNVEPDNADCYNYLGYLLWQMDKNDEAVAAYRQALALNGENYIAYNNLGVIFLDEKCQLQRALEMFEKALSLKPDYTLACFNIGRTLEAMGQTAESAKTYSQALLLNQANPEISNDEIRERLEQLFQV